MRARGRMALCTLWLGGCLRRCLRRPQRAHACPCFVMFHFCVWSLARWMEWSLSVIARAARGLVLSGVCHKPSQPVLHAEQLKSLPFTT